MRFNGRWFQCDDGVSRPVIRGEIQIADGDWEFLELLIDTGADRTVLSADVLGFLGLTPATSARQIGGLGGIAKSVTVSTLLRLTCGDPGFPDTGGAVVYAADAGACSASN